MKTNDVNTSLELAKRLSETVNDAWESGELLEQVTPTTQELLKFWFSEEYCSLRHRNFHAGQRQAILNIVYLHEVMGVRNVRQKQTAAVEWTSKVNELKPIQRMGREWEYVLVSEDNFYGLAGNGATLADIARYCKVSLSAATGQLFV